MKRLLLLFLSLLLMSNSRFLVEFPMAKAGDETGSKYFRIPSLLTLREKDGSLSQRVIALQDVRFSGFQDSPANIDSGIRISSDGGKSFGAHQLLKSFSFDDVAPGERFSQLSASFIDCALFQNYETGRVFATVNMFPWGGGIMKGNVGKGNPFGEVRGEKVLWLSSPFDLSREKRPTGESVWSKKAKKNHVTKMGSYYAVGVGQWPEFLQDSTGRFLKDKEGDFRLKRACQRKIYSKDHIYTGYFLNENYEICFDDGSPKGVVLKVPQIGSDKIVNMNLAYQYSIFQMYRTSYNFLIYSDDGGKSWSAPLNLTAQIQRPNEFVSYQIVSPGTGLYVDKGPHRGRLLQTIYTNVSPHGDIKAEIPCGIWSDDNGESWHRGEVVGNIEGVGKMSESVLALMPSGKIRIFSRSSCGYLATALSPDGGRSWKNVKIVPEIFNPKPSGCQITAFNYPQKIKGCEALILAAPQSQQKREKGTLWIGLLKDNEGEKIQWISKEIFPGDYAYSSSTPLPIFSAERNPAIGLYCELKGNQMKYCVLPLESLWER